MRIITDLEKRIIDSICEGQIQIGKILTDEFPELLLSVDRDKQVVELILPKMHDETEAFDKKISLIENIIYIQSFITYLEKEGYVLTGQFTQGHFIKATIATDINMTDFTKNPEKYTKYIFPDNKISKQILEYADITIFSTFHLKAFKNRNYNTIDDLRHFQVKVIAIIAISVSIILGLISLYTSCINKL